MFICDGPHVGFTSYYMVYLYNASRALLVARAQSIWYTWRMWYKYSLKNPISPEIFQQVFRLLCASIPPEERREESVQRALLQHSAYILYVYTEAESLLGMLAAWEFENVRFIEHFAVDEKARGKGLGGALLQSYVALDDRPVMLETEPGARSPMAQRRIRFYERAGFQLNAYAYEQPPMRKNDGWLPLRIMSWPDALDKEMFEELRYMIYREVYGLSSV
jgi:ribosomal protein S18 acetylase RimI-like enzyme